MHVLLSSLLSGCSLRMWLLGWKCLQYEPLLYSSEYLRYTTTHSSACFAVARVCVCVWCKTFNPTVPVYCAPAVCFRDDENEKQTFDASLLINRVEPSFKKPDNTFRWPPTIPAEWFSSVTSSAYWVITLWVLLVSCMPGASQSSLDLQWHLTWDTCWRYDGGSTAWSREEVL